MTAAMHTSEVPLATLAVWCISELSSSLEFFVNEVRAELQNRGVHNCFRHNSDALRSQMMGHPFQPTLMFLPEGGGTA